mmetsp:Transcript_60251/g.173852  ORF Transcript_60251/g.173852 Transcript_60251/m.173852 type:complete len:496 (-) Transcript_60251:42-1529(-)
MSVGYQHSILWRGEDPLKQKNAPKVDASKKVVRYFPGKVPRWAAEAEAKKKPAEEDARREAETEGRRGRSRERRGRRRGEAAAVVLEEQKEDPAAARLRRLKESVAAKSDVSERLQRHRNVHAARVLEAAEEDKDEEAKKEEGVEEDKGSLKKEELDINELSRGPLAELQLPMQDDDEDVDLQALRRERARELALEKRRLEEEVLKDEAEDEEDEDEDEDDSDESDSDPRRSTLLKPVFVSKSQRETVKEREAQQREEEAAREREKQRQKERKAESKSILVDTIRAEDEAIAAGIDENDRSDIELIDDDDEKNEAEEYELWKIRELKRIKRDKEERLERQKELEFIEKRRMMTDAEREADNKRLDASATKREDTKSFGFLQKYYHRGGFFQDKARTGEEPLYIRDYHEPLDEEKFDKTLLPKAMQLRRGQFGKKGQVKHTHLTEADTTDKSAAWAQNSKPIQRYQEKMAGVKAKHVFDRPSGSRPGGGSPRGEAR